MTQLSESKIQAPPANPEPRPAVAPLDAPAQMMMPLESPPQTAVPYRKLFRWGWFIVRQSFRFFLLAVGLGLVSQTLQQYTVQVLSVVVSGLQTGGVPSSASYGFLTPLLPKTLTGAAILFAVLALGGILLTFLERMSNVLSDTAMTAKLQQHLHDKLLRLGPAYHSKHDLGETMLVVSRFAGGAAMVLQDLISFPLLRGIGLVTAVIFLASNLDTIGGSPLWMRAALLVGLLLLPLGGWLLSSRVRGASTRVRDAELRMADELTNSLSLPLEVQMMGAQPQRAASFAARLKRYVREKVGAGIRNETATQFQAATPVVLQLLFLIYGVFLALKSGTPGSAGAILAIYYFVPQVVAPVQQIIQFIIGLNSSWPQVESVVEILEATPDVAERPRARPLSDGELKLEVDHVTFSYVPGGPRQLRDLSFSFARGQVTAIVARAGMGKSTLLNLVARIRDPDQGAVRLGGMDLREVTLESLHRHVAKVSQFPLYLADTVRANFQIARADATDAAIEAVCRKTGLWEVLVDAAGPGRQPLDYVLPRAVGEGLSGGQRRLLSLTRALLLQPTVLLLDEPTTGIDAIGRQLLIPVLRDACAGLTVLLVDHDMDFVSKVSGTVCVLENGAFTEVGSPSELAATPGLFQRLLQSSHDEALNAPDAAAASA